jgi:hypothetical protein
MYIFSIAADDSCALDRDIFSFSFINLLLLKLNVILYNLVNESTIFCYQKVSGSYFVPQAYWFHIILKAIF